MMLYKRHKLKHSVAKCATCYHCGYHPPGSWTACAEGADDPYGYHFCAVGYWEDSSLPIDDYWDNCKQYVEKWGVPE